ncbi:MAG: SUMF1/EgtB/PvdO family nonheme iron enzyme [Bacteriovoracaceae bacterium]|jgi:formylglycine-generating enzyme required for sulfatase activity|nr:SUMF1/EgtB/PvdO family nonheme iron enzyme [Bacteriovoracaceae bacterium]
MKKNILFILSTIFVFSCKDIDIDSAAKSSTKVGPPNLAPQEEWIQIPANAGGMGLTSFYVMKYEAKAMLNDESSVNSTGTTASPSTHKPVSLKDNQPWRNISANEAAAECESLGNGYHLISNPEWMAIARDIETQAANWTGGSVGSGCLYRGNSGETTTGDGTNVTDSCGYDGANPEAGSNRDLRAKHTLSSGDTIFDISGNIDEMVDWDKDTIGFQLGPTGCFGGELSSSPCGSLVDADYNTQNGGYNRTNGVGWFNGGFGGAAWRGGSWQSVNYAGAFSLSFSGSAIGSGQWTGFRCVYRP